MTLTILNGFAHLDFGEIAALYYGQKMLVCPKGGRIDFAVISLNEAVISVNDSLLNLTN